MYETGPIRRKSVDIGGLALALATGHGCGSGWGGWDEDDISEAIYAEFLSDMYTQTQSTVNYHLATCTSPVILNETRIQAIETLDSWNFEPSKLPEEEVLVCTIILFEALLCKEGMGDEINISLAQLTTFLSHLREIYRRQNSYHNFRHALDVLQAVHVFLYSAGVVPPVSILMLRGDAKTWRPGSSVQSNPYLSCLGNQELFALYIAAIGHDVGHPGFTNNFMKNAQTPLSVVYDNKSALEQMHYTLLLSIMHHHGLGVLLDPTKRGTSFRRLLYKTLLATDMSVHAEFMSSFQSLLNEPLLDTSKRQVLVCQALIKCADISNPGRPHSVSKQWANALMDEWTRQAQLERHLHLPASVTPSNNDPMVEANSQVFFIGKFTYPLFALVASAVPQLTRFATHCQDNLDIWQRRIAQLTNRSTPKKQPNKLTLDPPTTTSDFLTAFPLTLPRLFFNEEQHSESGSDSRPSSSLSSAAPFDQMSSPCVLPPSPSNPVPDNLAPKRPDTAMSNGNHSTRSANTNVSDSSTAIRAALKASVRKKKSFHRTSWTQRPVSTRENFPIGAHQLNEPNGLNHLSPVLQVIPPASGS